MCFAAHSSEWSVKTSLHCKRAWNATSEIKFEFFLWFLRMNNFILQAAKDVRVRFLHVMCHTGASVVQDCAFFGLIEFHGNTWNTSDVFFLFFHAPSHLKSVRSKKPPHSVSKVAYALFWTSGPECLNLNRDNLKAWVLACSLKLKNAPVQMGGGGVIVPPQL